MEAFYHKTNVTGLIFRSNLTSCPMGQPKKWFFLLMKCPNAHIRAAPIYPQRFPQFESPNRIFSAWINKPNILGLIRLNRRISVRRGEIGYCYFGLIDSIEPKSWNAKAKKKNTRILEMWPEPIKMSWLELNDWYNITCWFDLISWSDRPDQLI